MLESFSFNQRLLQEDFGYIRRESLQEFNTLLRVLPDVSYIVVPVVVHEGTTSELVSILCVNDQGHIVIGRSRSCIVDELVNISALNLIVSSSVVLS
jgi:hypothetical protein